jgi:hypothetical protein
MHVIFAAKGLCECDTSFGFGGILIAPFVFFMLLFLSIAVNFLNIKLKHR